MPVGLALLVLAASKWGLESSTLGTVGFKVHPSECLGQQVGWFIGRADRQTDKEDLLLVSCEPCDLRVQGFAGDPG